jgi:hypothetical protein
MRIKFTVNPTQFSSELKSSLAKKNNKSAIEKSLKLRNGQLVVKEIDKAKKEMVKDFLNLSVTREILAGPGSSNISGTLGGYGNLFSFIGFGLGDSPIDPIITLLEQTSYRFTNLSPRGKMKLIITHPSSQDIFAVTPLPWAPGISWAQRIERGLSGLGQYLNKSSNNSRSGAGIQTPNMIRSGGFSNSPYISSFVNKWSKKFLKIENGLA